MARKIWTSPHPWLRNTWRRSSHHGTVTMGISLDLFWLFQRRCLTILFKEDLSSNSFLKRGSYDIEVVSALLQEVPIRSFTVIKRFLHRVGIQANSWILSRNRGLDMTCMYWASNVWQGCHGGYCDPIYRGGHCGSGGLRTSPSEGGVDQESKSLSLNPKSCTRAHTHTPIFPASPLF